MRSETKQCQNCQQNFTIEPEDFNFYEKIKVPPPTWCSECRLIRRWAFMNMRKLYKRKCDMCDKKIITMFAPEKKIKVYCLPCWWSDKWNGDQYGRDYDPGRSFFEQLIELAEETPYFSLENLYPSMINSDYVSYAAYQKNSYLVFFADYCERVLYSDILAHVKDTMDSLRIRNSELCYGVVGGYRCYKTFFSEECDACHNVYFCRNCSSCSDCFGCSNLRGKSYHIWNIPYSKVDYQKIIAGFNLGSHKFISETKKKAREHWSNYPERYMRGNALNVNVTGDYVYESRNAKDCYMTTSVENGRYVQMISLPTVKDAYDYTGWGNNSERLYECLIVGESAQNVRFSAECWPAVTNIEYSNFAISSQNMFGCINIKKKQHCILNKEYTGEEFAKLRQIIIEDMDKNPYVDNRGRVWKYGEFLPFGISMFGYNETEAMKYFPLSKKEALDRGYNWFDYEETKYTPTVSAANLPDSIEDVPDSITEEIIKCLKCQRAFKIVNDELDLLRYFGLPLPRECPNCRYYERFTRVNPPKLWPRSCMCDPSTALGASKNTAKHFHGNEKCLVEFETSYAPDRPEIVYCEKCYQQEVY